jgi:hypothetical protein
MANYNHKYNHKYNQKINEGQPPKIRLNETEHVAPLKEPSPVRPAFSSTTKADSIASKKETARIQLSATSSIPQGVAPRDQNINTNATALPEEDPNETAKKSTVRVQIDEGRAKGDTVRLDVPSMAGAEEAVKKRTARINLDEVIDENDDIFKRRTALLDADNFSGVTQAPGLPRTVRIKRPESPPIDAIKKPLVTDEEKEVSLTAEAIDPETSKKSETARINLPPEVTEQPPTRRKTIRIKRPEGMMLSKPMIIAGSKAVARPSGPMTLAKEEEEVGAAFSVMTLVAILVGIALITVQSLTLRDFLQF